MEGYSERMGKGLSETVKMESTVELVTVRKQLALTGQM